MATLTPASEDTRIYECCILYSHPMTQKEESDLLKEIDALFAEANAVKISEDKWGRRGLAYTIKKHDEGNFIVTYWEMDPSKLKEIDTQLRILPGILRHLIVIPPKGYQVVEHSKTYAEWKQNQGANEGAQESEKEEEIKRRVAAKAKRQVKSAEEEKAKTEEDSKPLEKEKLSKELEKLISDDELDI